MERKILMMFADSPVMVRRILGINNDLTVKDLENLRKRILNKYSDDVRMINALKTAIVVIDDACQSAYNRKSESLA